MAARRWCAFTPQDVRSANKVCVIGHTTAHKIFGDEDPIGQVLAHQKRPVRRYRRADAERIQLTGHRPGRHRHHALHQRDETGSPAAHVCATSTSQVASRDEIAAAQQQIISLLRQRHNIRAGRDDDFTVRTQEEIADTATATAEVMTGLLAWRRLRFARRRWHRHHEHHARQRDRAHPRDRHSPGRRRAWPRHPHAIPDRSRVLSVMGGVIGIVAGIVASKIISHDQELADRRSRPRLDADRISRQRRRRHLFWILSGAQSRAARSDRCVALRIVVAPDAWRQIVRWHNQTAFKNWSLKPSETSPRFHRLRPREQVERGDAVLVDVREES